MKRNQFAITRIQGKELLKEALKQFHEGQAAKVVKQVSILLERVQHMEQIIEKAEKRLELTKNQLAAINEAKFIIKEYNQTIVYNDPELNVAWDSTEQW